MSQWHITRILHISNCKCHDQQVATNVKRIAWIAKGSKGTYVAIYRGRKIQYGSNKEIVMDFWFCPNDIEYYMKGTKLPWIINWLQPLDVQPILSSKNPTHQKTLLLQDAGFKFQDCPPMLPQHVHFFEAPIFDHLGPPNLDIYPTTGNNKSIRQNAYALMFEHCNKWKNACNIKGMVLGVIILPSPRLGAIILLESEVESNKKVCQITISHFFWCICSDFLNMVVASIGK